MTALNVYVESAGRSAERNVRARDHVGWIRVVFCYDREVKRDLVVCVDAIAKSQVCKVVVCESREHAVGVAVFAVEVNGPGFYRTRFQAEDCGVRLVVDFFRLSLTSVVVRSRCASSMWRSVKR